ncbi:Alpha/beta knot methyltransferase [Helicostylum pulchrum]|uniref:tRNA/rRNA methyltransferase SpoU type domain-containing protein n=1 Tax=Helicostylum pulchrum TaxID=562976 RepID=A0ABP9Y6J1_9FUNG|nr:Alpha/beta knot methyltransferase [Helicostylum pulchrum]
MSTSPFQYHIPQLFRRLANQHNATVKHLIALREKKKYRLDNKSVLIQGVKTLKELRDKGFQFNSIAITAKNNPNVESDIKYPAIDIVKHPDSFPAKHYYVTDIDVTRRILGTSSRPSNHEVFAEVPIPQSDEDSLKEKDRLLVFDGISDPGNLGTLIRTASALGWGSGLVASQSCDLYNDKTLRASRALSLSWKHKELDMVEALQFLKSNGFTPVVADMMPDKSAEIWSPELGTKTVMDTAVKQGSGIWFWNFKQQPKELPKKLALILSSEHHGVNDLNDEIRVSIPMSSNVESLNVANAGSIIMNELNRYLAL